MKFIPKQIKIAAAWWGNSIYPINTHLAKGSPLNTTRTLNTIYLKNQLEKFPKTHFELRDRFIKEDYLLHHINQNKHSKIFSDIVEIFLKEEANYQMTEYEGNKEKFKHDFLKITLNGPLSGHYEASKILQESLRLHSLLVHQPYSILNRSMGIYAYNKEEGDHYYNGRIFVGCPLTQYDLKPLYIPEEFSNTSMCKLGL